VRGIDSAAADPGGPLCLAYERPHEGASISYAVRRIFEPAAHCELPCRLPWSSKMVHTLTSDDQHRGSSRGHEDRSSLGGYRFGRVRGTHRHGRAALNRLSGYLKTMIEAVANSKLRRMERELELRGIHRDRVHEGWMRQAPPAERQR
jgi:hypothetical protein